jgi:hypothetical protein
MELPQTPAPIRAITGEERIWPQEQEWFDSLVKYLGYANLGNPFVELRQAHICVSLSDERPSDDTLSLLVINNHVVASVLRWRDSFNMVCVYFSLHLTPEVVDQLRAHLDRIDS